MYTDALPIPFILSTNGNESLKALWKIEKMLVTSIFSISYHIFRPIRDLEVMCTYLNIIYGYFFIWLFLAVFSKQFLVGKLMVEITDLHDHQTVSDKKKGVNKMFSRSRWNEKSDNHKH